MTTTPTDNLYANQWYLTRIGDIETIWDEYNGAGVHVGVYDDGIEYTHPDLDDNYDPSLHVVIKGNVIDPMPVDGPHGTSVAGIIAAELNGTGTVGVAWGAGLTGVNIFSGAASTFAGFQAALQQLGQFDVTNNSWGYDQRFAPDSSIAFEAGLFEASLVNGRDGLGTINVKAAGNDDANANSEAIEASRATVTVGAYDDTGDASYYSNHGANLLVSAPSNGGFQGQTTTDLQGRAGYANGDYTNDFGGTSGATPVVTGVVSLMLDANDALGWRDVQTILSLSAHEVGSGVGGSPTRDEDHVWFDNGDTTWNGGGRHFSEDYGYGSVNAYNAVRMAEIWSLFGPAQTSANEATFSASSGAYSLPDLGTVDADIAVASGGFEVEYVNVTLDITHTNLPDLVIDLISPDGTQSRLFTNDGRPNSADSGWTWTLGANAFRGEAIDGNWTLRVADTASGDSGTLHGVTLDFFGRDSGGGPLDDDVFTFTDEYSETVSRDGARAAIDGGIGNDWVNAAAVASATTVSLTAGVADIDGVAASIVGIENIVSGDGDDILVGDGEDNQLFGMRGDDDISGGAGDDVGDGGDGNDAIRGEQGEDTLHGGAGDDTMLGGGGRDAVSGDQGFDLLRGNGGADTLFGDLGKDTLSGGSGSDTLEGGAGKDRLLGNGGDDEIDGGDGNDVVSGGAGDDALTGGGGGDRFVFGSEFGVDTVIDFEDGFDRFDFRTSATVSGLSDLDIDAAGSNAIVMEVGDPVSMIVIVNAAGLIEAGDFLF